jgi:hypothetical protein
MSAQIRKQLDQLTENDRLRSQFPIADPEFSTVSTAFETVKKLDRTRPVWGSLS